MHIYLIDFYADKFLNCVCIKIKCIKCKNAFLQKSLSFCYKKMLIVLSGVTNVDVTQAELQKIFTLIMVSFNFIHWIICLTLISFRKTRIS